MSQGINEEGWKLIEDELKVEIGVKSWSRGVFGDFWILLNSANPVIAISLYPRHGVIM